ncbi:HEAT repeat domain-containing protein [Methanobrevibacter sp.]|uniref:HEAT repeat domain-containing protein n=1 Tax=Methanobrevibacter sp. TaxID=66852 RepID=UPI002E7694D7|nr:HEAT repeat domain-containing protein [Methanobrevibacter sp.]MEE0939504.1 HEAT repeat domain-containing protein [Methanobrevibacter sp.]
MSGDRNDNDVLRQLRDINKNRECWRENIDDVAAKLNGNYSVAVKAKSLWILGEMGLNYPAEIEAYLEDIVGYMQDDDSKLRERSTNAMGRIGRADKNLVIPYLDKLMNMRFDESENIRHAFIWACENIASNAPVLFCEKLEIFYELIFDSGKKVRIEAPEMFRVVGKTKPDCVKPYLDKLEWIAQNDENPIVRIHSAGAVRITKKSM